MASPLISVRKLDANHDPIYGIGQQAFLTDLDAVAQIIDTRLLLLQGEWWADLSQGLPLFQQILGTPNASRQAEFICLLIQEQILLVPYVLQVTNVQTSYDTVARRFSYSATVETQFGTTNVSFTPGQNAALGGS